MISSIQQKILSDFKGSLTSTERKNASYSPGSASFFLMGVKHYIFAKFTGRTLCKAPAEHLSCLFRSVPPHSNRFSLQFLQEGINAATPRRFGSIMQVKA